MSACVILWVAGKMIWKATDLDAPAALTLFA